MLRAISIMPLIFTITGCGPIPTPTPSTVGTLTVTVGFSAGPGVACTGATSITLSGPGGASKSSGFLNFAGTGGQVDATHFGCTVTVPFGNLAPGNWTSTAATRGQCVDTVRAGQFTSRLIWEGVCS